MDTEDVRDAITLLEEVVNSDTFKIKNEKIKSEHIVSSFVNNLNQMGGYMKPHRQSYKKSKHDKKNKEVITSSSEKKQPSSSSSSSEETTTYEDDSITVKSIHVPSEFYHDGGGNTSESHYNLAFSESSHNTNVLEQIINVRE
jgi:hypothetical protein